MRTINSKQDSILDVPNRVSPAASNVMMFEKEIEEVEGEEESLDDRSKENEGQRAGANVAFIRVYMPNTSPAYSNFYKVKVKEVSLSSISEE